jgi:tetratricopeptide (TPR) repeat protein
LARHYRNRGHCYGATGEPVKAIDDFTEAIRLDPKDEESHSGRGWCYAQTGEHAKAVADFNDASWLELKARLDPVTAGVCDRAIADCTEAIQVDPTDAVAYYNRSWRYAQKGDYEKAIDDVTEALRLDPQVPEIWEKYSIMCSVVSKLSNRLQQIAPTKSPLRRIQLCAWKLGMTGGNILGSS